MSRTYVALALILMISISSHAWNNENNLNDYFLSEVEFEEDLWVPDYDFTSELLWSESSWIDMDILCELLLELCSDLEIPRKEVYEIFPDLWEPDYGPYLFCEDDLYY